MNRYGAMAKAHWAEHLPRRYRQIEDPAAYFTMLGDEVEREIETMLAAMPTTEPDSLAEDQRAGWWRMARFNVESDLLREMVLLPAEDDEEDRPADPDSLLSILTEIYSDMYRDLEEMEESEAENRSR